jgi:anion transporter
MAVTLWIFGGDFLEPATVGLIVISIFFISGVLTWKDAAQNHAAWTTLLLLATLVTLAGGLSKTGFVKWFGDGVGSHVGGYSPTVTILILTAIYFFSHYMFASLTAHTTAMLPVILAVGMGVEGVPAEKLALMLALTTGIMGVITPYATGPGLAYYESGYLMAKDFWRLGTIFGLIFLGALFLLGFPLIMWR